VYLHELPAVAEQRRVCTGHGLLLDHRLLIRRTRQGFQRGALEAVGVFPRGGIGDVGQVGPEAQLQADQGLS
jgi:hypothetical protein